MNLTSPLTLGIIAGVLGLLVVGIFLINRKRIKKEAPSKDDIGKVKDGTLCRIYDYITRKVYNDKLGVGIVELLETIFGSLGQPRLYNGDWLFPIYKYASLHKETDTDTGEVKESLVTLYQPVLVDIDLSKSPKVLWADTQHPEVGIIMELTKEDDESFFDKHKDLLVWSGAILGVIAILVLNMSQG